jgi:ribosomal protein S27AE
MSAHQQLAAKDQIKLNQIINELKARHVREECPRCGNKDWLVEALALLVSALPVKGPGPYIPAASVTCTNCGATFIHNLLTLGLWP